MSLTDEERHKLDMALQHADGAQSVLNNDYFQTAMRAYEGDQYVAIVKAAPGDIEALTGAKAALDAVRGIETKLTSAVDRGTFAKARLEEERANE